MDKPLQVAPPSLAGMQPVWVSLLLLVFLAIAYFQDQGRAKVSANDDSSSNITGKSTSSRSPEQNSDSAPEAAPANEPPSSRAPKENSDSAPIPAAPEAAPKNEQSVASELPRLTAQNSGAEKQKETLNEKDKPSFQWHVISWFVTLSFDVGSAVLVFYFINSVLHLVVSALSVPPEYLPQRVWQTFGFTCAGVLSIGCVRTLVRSRKSLRKKLEDFSKDFRPGHVIRESKGWQRLARFVISTIILIFTIQSTQFHDSHSKTVSSVLHWRVVLLSYIVFNIYLVSMALLFDVVFASDSRQGDKEISSGWQSFFSSGIGAFASYWTDVGEHPGAAINHFYHLCFIIALVVVLLTLLSTLLKRQKYHASLLHKWAVLIVSCVDAARHVYILLIAFGSDELGNPLFFVIPFLVKWSVTMIFILESQKWFDGRTDFDGSTKIAFTTATVMLEWTVLPWWDCGQFVCTLVRTVAVGMKDSTKGFFGNEPENSQPDLTNRRIALWIELRDSIYESSKKPAVVAILSCLIAILGIVWVRHYLFEQPQEIATPTMFGPESRQTPHTLRLPYQVCSFRWTGPDGLDAVDLSLAAELAYEASKRTFDAISAMTRFHPKLGLVYRNASALLAEFGSSKEIDMSSLVQKVSILVSANHNVTIVSFRGTSVLEEWFVDFRLFTSSFLVHFFLVGLSHWTFSLPWHMILPDHLISLLAFSFQPPSALSDAQRGYLSAAETAIVNRIINKSLDSGKVILVGHSLGGVLAQKLASDIHSGNWKETISKDSLTVFAVNSPGFLYNQFAFRVSEGQMVPHSVHVNTASDPASHVDSPRAFVQTVLCNSDAFSCHRLVFPLCELYCHCRELCPTECDRVFATSGKRIAQDLNFNDNMHLLALPVAMSVLCGYVTLLLFYVFMSFDTPSGGDKAHND